VSEYDDVERNWTSSLKFIVVASIHHY